MNKHSSDTGFETGPSAGDLLRAEMAKRGLSVNEFAEDLGVTRQSLSGVLNGRLPISEVMSRRIGVSFGHEPRHWLDLDQRRRQRNASVLPTRAAIMVDHEIDAAQLEGELIIDPFEPAQLKQASYDFALSPDVIDLDAAKQSEVEGCLTVAPGQVLNVETAEHIELNNRFVGRVGGTTAVSRLGIIVNCGFQVDPGFEGKLEFTLINPTREAINISLTDPVLSMELHRLLSEPREKFKKSAHKREQSVREKRLAVLVDNLGGFFEAVNVSQEDEKSETVEISIPGLSGFSHKNSNADRDRAVNTAKRLFFNELLTAWDEADERVMRKFGTVKVTNAQVAALYDGLGLSTSEDKLQLIGDWLSGWAQPKTAEGSIWCLPEVLEDLPVREFIDAKLRNAV